MTTYVSILRGINVGGHKPVKMGELQKVCESMGFHNVVTYVQSGNVIFAGNDAETAKIEQMISRRLEKDFGFEVQVIVFTSGELRQIVENNPLSKEPDKDPAFLHVTFLAAAPADFREKEIEKWRQSGEEIFFSDEAVYLYCPHGYGRTKLNNNFLEAKLGVAATTRNWKTVNELLRIANEQTK